MILSQATYSDAAVGKDNSILNDIHQPQKCIAVQQRDTQSLQPELEKLSKDFVEFRATGSTEEIVAKLQAHIERKHGNYPLLIDDMAGLIKAFQAVTKSVSFRVLLATIDNNMCRKFHTDVNHLRMLCTYMGQGTMWVPSEGVKEVINTGKRELHINPNHIQQTKAGDVIILKGALYPDGNPILHRSPTIEESGEERLLLRIDMNNPLLS